MSWIEIVPRRWDFCGRVGCPLCYVWQDDATDEVIEAVDKMLRDLLGAGVTATPEQRAQVEAAIQKIHDDNVRRNAEPDPPLDLEGSAAAFTEADNKRRLEMQLNYAAKLKARAATYTPVARNKSIDELGISAETLAAIEQEKKLREQKEKQLTWSPLASEALKREIEAKQREFTAQRQRELAMENIRDAMKETPKWIAQYLQSTRLMQDDYARSQMYTLSQPDAIVMSVPIGNSGAQAMLLADKRMRITLDTGGSAIFGTPEEAVAYIVKNIDPGFAYKWQQFVQSRDLDQKVTEYEYAYGVDGKVIARYK